MHYKCQYCDPTVPRGQKPIRSIDTEIDEFINDHGKYFHKECYVKSSKDKGYSQDKIEKMCVQKEKKSTDKVIEAEQKDKFLKWIMNYYDGSLPSYFLKKLKSIREGNYEGIPEPITYEVLLDIYVHMENYLRKRSFQMRISDTTQQMNYDLAVVVGNYGRYKKFKERQKLNQSDTKKVEQQIEVTNKVQKVKQKEDDEDKEFDITEVINDLLL